MPQVLAARLSPQAIPGLRGRVCGRLWSPRPRSRHYPESLVRLSQESHRQPGPDGTTSGVSHKLEDIGKLFSKVLPTPPSIHEKGFLLVQPLGIQWIKGPFYWNELLTQVLPEILARGQHSGFYSAR